MFKLAEKLILSIDKWLALLIFGPGLVIASCFLGEPIAEIRGHLIFDGDEVFIDGQKLSLEEIKQLDER